MADQILLYLSAALDLEAERDFISRAVTEIPVTLGWRILQTPRHAEMPDLEAIQLADMHVLLLGGDIRAPVGLEWMVARRSGKLPVLFLKRNIPRTPAALVFVRDIESQSNWLPFENLADLRHQLLVLLGDHILEQAIHYSLRPKEFKDLQTWRQELESAQQEPIDETRGGAGDSSIILSTERYVPSQGVLIQPKKKPKGYDGPYHH